MSWYRVYQGLPYDARLGVVARRSGLSRAEALALYIFLFDTASRAQGGSVAAFDPEETGVALDIDTAKIVAAMKALRDKGLVNDAGCIADWHRQVPPSTSRVRAYRKRKQQYGTAPLQRRAQPADPDSPAEARDRRTRLGNPRNTRAGESST